MSDIFGGGEAAIEAGVGSEKPLTDEERALLQRQLSDPFSIPQQFKTWLVAYLEGSDMLLSRSSVQGLSQLLGAGGGEGVFGLLPAGIIFPFGGSSPPVGAVLCDGTSYAIAGKYDRLFAAIGYLYGGAGPNFNVPDLRRRVPFGAGAGRGLGGSDGKAEASRDIRHHHNFGQTSNPGGDHSHSISTDSQGSHSHGNDSGLIARTNLNTVVVNSSSGTARYLVDGSTSISSSGAHSHGGGTSGSGTHQHFVSGDTSGGFEQDYPAYLTVGFIINY
jgi:microcystin-dependent protein